MLFYVEKYKIFSLFYSLFNSINFLPLHPVIFINDRGGEV